MADLRYRQEKIQAKRKQTSFRDFIKELGSRYVLSLYRYDSFVTKYPQTDRIANIYSQKEYEKLSLEFHGRDYDLGQSFWKQFQQLRLDVPKGPTIQFYADQNDNTTFGDGIFGAKDVYLSFVVGDTAEKVMYSCSVFTHSYCIFSSYRVLKSENIYHSKVVEQSFNIFYSKYIYSSSNVWFSVNLIGCQECLFCDNLENQSYCIRNQQYTKEEYVEKKQQLLSQKEQFLDWYQTVPNKAINRNCEHVSGNMLYKCQNVENGFVVNNLRNGKNCFMVGGVESNSEFYDNFDTGINSHYMYAAANAGDYSEHIYCSSQVAKSSHIYHCYFMQHCSYCLGCIGLKNKQFCLFNKQYSKEEWHKKVDQIFTQMEKEGVLGNFFPPSMNPFYFNDTAAYLIDPSFTKEEVEKEGYLRRDEEIKVDIPDSVEVIDTKDLDIVHYDESLLKKVIRDEKGNYYRIMPLEYQFCKKYNLPLSTLHRVDRLKQHFTFQ